MGLHQKAWRQDRGEEFTEKLGEIVDLLETAPFEAGEPAFRLSALRMQVRSVTIRPVCDHYGVCEDRQLVFIRAVMLLAMPQA